jgi:hypothetical protein
MLLAPFLWIFCEFDEKVLDNLSLESWRYIVCCIYGERREHSHNIGETGD